MRTKNLYKKNSKEDQLFHLLFDLDGNKASLYDFKKIESDKEHKFKNHLWSESPQFECIYFAELKNKADKKQNTALNELYNAANSKEYQVFTSLIKNINVSKFQADEIIKMIDLCISLDMITLAFDLATKAKKMYPEHNKIESAYKALSPPKVIGTRPRQDAGIIESQKWFEENSRNHKGKWVAVNNGKLLAEADTLKELKATINGKYVNMSVFIEKIL